MKNTLKVLGIIALVAVIGFGVMGCSNGDDDDNTKTPTKGGGDGGVLTFTGDIPEAIQTELNACIAATISYLPAAGVLSATAMPTSKDEAEQQINGGKIGEFSDDIATIKSGKSKLNGTTMDTYDFAASGSYVVYIKFDNSGNKTWVALVTFTNGSGTVAWSAFKNANDLASSGGPGGDSGGLPAGALTGITVPSALQGTWVGDTDNGTLVFTATGVGTSSANSTKAYSLVAFLKSSGAGTVTITDSKIRGSISGYAFDIYTYTISGSTLTIKDKDGEDTQFEGTKQ
jgi:uncharacterized lipoprotein NlpE involved in copper resistance